jgi:hypothetical protein
MTGLKILENNKNIQSIISLNTNILLRRFRLKFLRIMYSISCYKEPLNFENTLYLELSVAMLPLIISATWIVPQSLFKNLKILDLENTLVVEIQKGVLLYSCYIVRKFLNIDTEHNTQQSQNAEARRR